MISKTFLFCLERSMKRLVGTICGIMSLNALNCQAGQAVTLEWTRQLGTSAHERSYGVSADGLGNVYMTGTTYGGLTRPHPGGDSDPDAFLSKYGSAGNFLWSRQLGTDNIQEGRAVSADGL